MSSRPKILVVGLELDWAGAARLPHALQDAGFEVGVACRAGAFLAHTRFRDRFFPLPDKIHGEKILARIETIVREWPPDLLVPTDDCTAGFLAGVHEAITKNGDSGNLAELLKRSLGNPPAVREALSKRQTLETARRLGVRVPASQTVSSRSEALAFGGRHGFPIVLKRSSGFAGSGVFICRNEADIARAFRILRWDETILGRAFSAFARLCGWRMESRWLPVDQSITASRFIAGKCAMSLTAAFEGRMLAALTAEKVESLLDDKGPSSVVRFVRNEEMRRASQTLLQHWKLTGLIGFDFMLDAQGQAWLIECNPRPTPLAHLGARAGEDLCRALRNHLAGEPPLPPATAPPGLIVAHFPAESWRDQRSPYLTSAFHDVPADDPELLKCLRQTKPPKPWFR